MHVNDTHETKNSIFSKYLKEYFGERKDLDSFECQVNEKLTAYEEAEERKRKALLEQVNVPDEEGFITVVSGKPSVFEMERPNVKDVPKDTDNPVYPNFYRQVGSGDKHRAQQMEELRNKFEEDKKLLAKLKESKIFKPDL